MTKRQGHHESMGAGGVLASTIQIGDFGIFRASRQDRRLALANRTLD